jgi:flagellar basal-body rod protein FlgB
MDLEQMGLFKLMSRKMGYLGDRQQVLAQNIANMNTPDYKASDLKPFTFRNALADSRRLTPTATSASHLSGTVAEGMRSKSGRDHMNYETTPDGNGVVIEQQMLKMAETSNDYQTMLNLYRKQVNMIRTAIRSGG